MARRVRIHSRDIQPQIAAPKGLFSVPRVQRFDWPANYPTTAIDEVGRKYHVGTTTDTPDVTVTVEGFSVNHDVFAYLTGYSPSTFPASGVSVTQFTGVDVIGKIRDSSTSNVLSTIYVKRGVVSQMDASFGVSQNSTVTYTIQSNSKKELKNPVKYERFVLASGATTSVTLGATPQWLPLTSGWTLNAYKIPVTGGRTYLDERTDYSFSTTAGNLTNNTVTLSGMSIGDEVWFTYVGTASETFLADNNYSVPAIHGKYVPVTISLQSIPRVQSVTIRANMNAERILEMGGLGKPVGYEVGVPDITGDITVLKTDTDLINILQGQATSSTESDMEYENTTTPLKIQLKNPTNPTQVVLTYYVPDIQITALNDTSSVNGSIQQTFSWMSSLGELIVISGAGPY